MCSRKNEKGLLNRKKRVRFYVVRGSGKRIERIGKEAVFNSGRRRDCA